MPQGTLYNALQIGERTLTEYAFQILEQVARLGSTADPGDPRSYGGSHTGAALLYLLRCGSTDDFTKVQTLLSEHQILRYECCRSGDLDAERYSELWIHSYTHSTSTERSQILAVLDVDISEGDDIDHIVSNVREHSRMKRMQNSMGSQISPTWNNRNDSEEPENRSIIPDRMLPAFHKIMIVVALSVVFCISGVVANFLYIRVLLVRGKLHSVEDSDSFLISFILGGIVGVSTVWSWRYTKKK